MVTWDASREALDPSRVYPPPVPAACTFWASWTPSSTPGVMTSPHTDGHNMESPIPAPSPASPARSIWTSSWPSGQQPVNRPLSALCPPPPSSAPARRCLQFHVVSCPSAIPPAAPACSAATAVRLQQGCGVCAGPPSARTPLQTRCPLPLLSKEELHVLPELKTPSRGPTASDRRSRP